MTEFDDADIESHLLVSEKAGFVEQVKIIRDGIKKGLKYDGCTAVPDFDFGYDCCCEHDAHYSEQDITRAQADQKLRECIRKKGYFLLPWIYWIGVRLVGGSHWINRGNEHDEAEEPLDVDVASSTDNVA